MSHQAGPVFLSGYCCLGTLGHWPVLSTPTSAEAKLVFTPLIPPSPYQPFRKEDWLGQKELGYRTVGVAGGPPGPAWGASRGRAGTPGQGEAKGAKCHQASYPLHHLAVSFSAPQVLKDHLDQKD